MAIKIQHFSDISQEQVTDAYNLLVQIVSEVNPTVDYKRGAVKDLVIYLSSVLSAANQANIDLIRQANNLNSLSTNPLLSDTTLVDNLASNYKTTRLAGTVATGPIAVVLSAQNELVIPQGTVFTADSGQTFLADDNYTAKINISDVLVSTDRPLISNGDGTYFFIVNATSSDVGSSYHISQGTSLTAGFPDSTILRAYAAADFLGGADPETNSALLNRLEGSISNLSLSNRPCIEGFIRSLNLPSYDNSFSVSTVGFGDAEQQRYHSIFPVAFGGRMDCYVRTQSVARNVQLTKTATFVGTTADSHGIWQIAISREDIPGFYEISRITLPLDINNLNVTSFAITSDVRGFDLSVGTTPSTTFFPDIAKSLEAVYSRYQTAVIQFVDTTTSVSGLTINTSTNTYTLLALVMPDIDKVQDGVSDLTLRSPVGDCLIKAPVPCFISIGINVGLNATDVAPDLTTVQNTTASVVNNLGFTGRLPASVIFSAVQPLLSGTAIVGSVVLSGLLRRPDGTILSFNSNNLIDVGNDTPNYVSSKTVAFLLNPSDVVVTTYPMASLPKTC